MKSKLLVILVLSLMCLTAMALTPSTSTFLSRRVNNESPQEGTNPRHAADIAGQTIPESSATQPDKPIILSKDSNDPKWGELKPEVAFDHTKHHDVTHSLDGKTATTCVYCHHTEQPMPVPGHPYLKKSERTAVLTAAQFAQWDAHFQSLRAKSSHPFPATTPARQSPLLTG